MTSEEMPSRIRPKRHQWTENLIDAIKAQVKADLDHVEKNEGTEQRLLHASKMVQQLEQDTSSEGYLRRFIYIISALLHHERFGGLNPQQIDRLAEIAEATLRVQGIQPERSKLAFLYGELHLALGQIARKMGHHWRAAWEHLVSTHLTKESQPGGMAFQNLVMANRSLRLGMGKLAVEKYVDAEKGHLIPSAREKARLGRIKALRLSSRESEAKELLEETERGLELSVEGALELDWERASLEVQHSGSLDAIFTRVKKNGTHRKAIYVLEEFVRARTYEGDNWIRLSPRLRTILRDKELKVLETGFLYTACFELERIEDRNVPASIGFAKLGSVLDNSWRFLSIDTELFFWVAAVRWLNSNDCANLARLALERYSSMCLALSDGTNKDTLRLFV